MPKKKFRFSWDWISIFFVMINVWGGVVVGTIFVLVLIASIALLRLFVLGWFSGQIALPAAVSTSSPIVSLPIAINNSSPILTLPPAQVSNTFNGSFTELFSGTGWSDGPQTTAYLDQTATAISLVPDFTVTPAVDNGGSVGKIPDVPAGLTGTITKTETGYVISALGNTITSVYPGELHFGYDRTTGNTLVVYAAYVSHVFQIDARGVATDYSERFGQRAFGGGSNGELAVHPVIFSEDGAWWIASGEGSLKPFLSKISGSSVIDYATLAFPQEGTLRALPGTESHTIFVSGNANKYVLHDNGFAAKGVRWVSTRLNDRDGVVTKAVISRVDDSGPTPPNLPLAGEGSSPFSKGELEGVVRYFLSNDGGVTWIPAALGTPVKFASSGGDFRFKVELSPTAGNKYVTPWVSTVAVEYNIIRN